MKVLAKQYIQTQTDNPTKTMHHNILWSILQCNDELYAFISTDVLSCSKRF